MEEDEKLAKQIHQQQLYDAEHDPYTGQQHRHHQHPSSSSFSSFPHFSAATPGQSATSATAIPFPFSSLMASHFSMDENDPRSRALRLIQLRSVLAGMPMDPSQLHMLLGAQRAGRRGMGGGGGFGGTGGSVPTSGPSGDFPLDEYGIPDPEQMEYQQLLEFCDALGEVKQRGLDAQQLSLLPTYHWKPSRKGRAAGGSRWKDDGDEKRVAAAADVRLDDEQCSICLTPYEEGEEIKRLPCLHVFHSDCVDPWSAATTALAAVDPLQPQSPRSAHRIASSCCCRSASRLSGWVKNEKCPVSSRPSPIIAWHLACYAELTGAVSVCCSNRSAILQCQSPRATACSSVHLIAVSSSLSVFPSNKSLQCWLSLRFSAVH